MDFGAVGHAGHWQGFFGLVATGHHKKACLFYWSQNRRKTMPKMIVQVVSESERPYMGKKGAGIERFLTLLDWDEKFTLKNTFDLVLSEEEFKAVKGKYVRQCISVGITDLEPGFGGRLRARGVVIGPVK
jgi:hypothetical protein